MVSRKIGPVRLAAPAVSRSRTLGECGYNGLRGDEASDANLLYVGLTRAQDHLVLTWTGSSAFTRRVEKSSRARPWNNA